MLQLARESDWEEIKRLSVQIHDLHVQWRPDIFYHSEEPYPKEAFQKNIHERMVYVYKADDTVLGYVVLCLMSKGGPGVMEKKLLRLESICVDEATRGEGIGTAMVAGVRALAKAFGCDGVLLGMHPENEQALRFYQKCGFTIRTINLEMSVD
jgi:ribosomal protein S18 acetylase RimI-like enzyme